MKVLRTRSVPARLMLPVLRQYARANGYPFTTLSEILVVWNNYKQIAVTQN